MVNTVGSARYAKDALLLNRQLIPLSLLLRADLVIE
jgi:hypothetical protein